MKVSRLPIDPGPAGWNEILPTAPTLKSLEEKITSDWLIIGAGFAGLTAARRLSQLRPKEKITILDARRVAEGPAGRNSGFMIDLPHILSASNYSGAIEHGKQQTRFKRHAIAYNANIAAEYEMSAEAFSQSGKINAAATSKGTEHNKSYAAYLTELGEEYEILDEKQLRELSGITYYRGGLFTPHAALIQPAMFIRTMAEALCLSNDIQIFENSPVLQLNRVNGDWQAETTKGTVIAPKVILAVNGHITSFGYFSKRLMPIFTFASMTRSLTADEQTRLGGAPQWAFTPADPRGTTVRRISGIGGDRIVIRNRFVYKSSQRVGEAELRRIGIEHEKAFSARFAMLDSVDMEYRWGGQLCISRNDVPAFGEIEENLYSACCQNALGTVNGTLSGMLTAELATSRESEILSDYLNQPVPTQLPPEPLASLGANAYIRWGEWMAGAEF